MNFFQKVVYFFLTLNLIIFHVICQGIPSPRYEQANSLVGTRLYFFGGIINSTTTNEVWYIDLSNFKSTSTLQWKSDVSMTVEYNLGASCVNPIDNSTVYLVGGRPLITNNFLNTSSIYVFNSKNSQWSTLNITGFNNSFIARNELPVTINNNGRIFLFGGRKLEIVGAPLFNDINILDTTTMTWSTPVISQNVPTPRGDHAAVLLPTGIIIYIGGYTVVSSINSAISMNEIQLFDTNSLSWTTRVCT
ncbi:hypothetical protein C2G38_522374 [Gigaspora rosea]|uniref:Galactose oxidase n=1 Tax=Gigaspora rosea TaxID=44941 RepID=A0A397UCA5_9GLOM|nr:hypothetical protein C2G38_522374 [Gigaspora rosea]